MVDLSRKTETPLKLVMEDVHKERDEHQLSIDQVGVNQIQYPVVVLDRRLERQHTVATLSMAVNLSHSSRGTHMSRFIEVLNQYKGDLTMSTLTEILHLLKERLGADSARFEATFPYFLDRVAPVTCARALMGYECAFRGEVNGDWDDFMLRVRVPVAALCPCSKKISDYGAHNQRGYVTIEVWSTRTDDGTPHAIWIEDLVEVAESSGSAPVYPLLKRPDERYVTMQAYDNPTFVEDIVRSAAEQLKNDPRVARFRLHVENHESIHSHNVYASLDWTRT